MHKYSETTSTTAIEFDKVRKLLADLAHSQLGKNLALQMSPYKELQEVDSVLQETSEAVQVLTVSDLNLSGLIDIKDLAKFASLGSTLNGQELNQIKHTLVLARSFRSLVANINVDVEILAGLAEQINLLSDVCIDIEHCLDDDDAIKDGASANLKHLRKSIIIQNNRIRDRLEHMVNLPNVRKHLQDALITMRGERFVLPVKAESKQYISGIIHDQSASGATLFVEPEAIVRLTNELKQLRLAEKQECEKLLKELSQLVGCNYDALVNNCNILGEVDFIFAKGRLSRKLTAIRPQMIESRDLRLIEARHPLLPKETVVPIDLRLMNCKQLIITGPNTGGKTVALKTVGLLSMMAQAGLFIPAMSGSQLPVFKEFYIDIGDEQSIEQSLSTFSGHLRKIVAIIENSWSEDLILLDELGAGTDPEEGAALAIAILSELLNRQAMVFATSHFSELKSYAYSHSAVENAAVEFNSETLSPTYKLCVGISGSSNAFLISRRLGLSERVISRATEMLSGEHRKFDEALAEIEIRNKLLSEEEKNINRLKLDLDRQLAIVTDDINIQKDKQAAILKKARSEARDIVSNARNEAEKIIADLRLLQKERKIDNKIIEHSIRQARENITNNITNLHEEDEISQTKIRGLKPVNLETIKSGDIVYVQSLKQDAEVLDVTEKSLLVQTGSFRIKVISSDCLMQKAIHLPYKLPAWQKQQHNIMGAEFNKAIDLRGQTLAEAINNAEKHLDDAICFGANEILLIHGKGTGVLRTGLKKHFVADARVHSVTLADLNQGGSGASVVKLR